MWNPHLKIEMWGTRSCWLFRYTCCELPGLKGETWGTLICYLVAESVAAGFFSGWGMGVAGVSLPET
jgi:hypothetical protein